MFGCQRFVWCPKWTPASRNVFIDMTAMKSPCNGLVECPWDEKGRTGIQLNNKETLL